VAAVVDLAAQHRQRVAARRQRGVRPDLEDTPVDQQVLDGLDGVELEAPAALDLQ
jgi:hypothetical protein